MRRSISFSHVRAVGPGLANMPALSFISGLYLVCSLSLMTGCGGSASSTASAESPQGGTAAGESAESSEAEQAWALHRLARLPVEADDGAWGSPIAPVTLVEFQDLECPFCARSQATLAALQAKYGPEKLRIVFKHHPLPFHEQARVAHIYAQALLLATDHDTFMKFVSLVYDKREDLSLARLQDLTVQLGADPEALTPHFALAEAKVEQGIAKAKELGAAGTPAFFINGVRIVGAQPEEKFVGAIDAELAAADELLASGSRSIDVYPLRLAANEEHLKSDAEAKKKSPSDLVNNVAKWSCACEPFPGGTHSLSLRCEVTRVEPEIYLPGLGGGLHPNGDHLEIYVSGHAHTGVALSFLENQFVERFEDWATVRFGSGEALHVTGEPTHYPDGSVLMEPPHFRLTWTTPAIGVDKLSVHKGGRGWLAMVRYASNAGESLNDNHLSESLSKLRAKLALCTGSHGNRPLNTGNELAPCGGGCRGASP